MAESVADTQTDSGVGLKADSAVNPGSNPIADLIGRVALGDRAAFGALYAATSAKLFGICLRILNDRAEAEDALQEIYVRVWRRASSFAAGGYSPISWLAAIARNHAIDRLRARRPDSVELDAAPAILDDEPGPEAAAMAASERRRIDACLDELPGARSDAVRGAYLDGHSYAELAERFEVPLNTMRTWLRRSLMTLKECLER